MSSKLQDIQRDDNERVGVFVKALMLDYETKYQEIHDVALFKVASNTKHSNKVNDLFESVIQSVPKSMTIHMSPKTSVIRNRGLRSASFTIFVTLGQPLDVSFH